MSFSDFSLSSYQCTNRMQREKNILRNTWHVFLWAPSLIYKISLGMILITRYISSHLDFCNNFQICLSLCSLWFILYIISSVQSLSCDQLFSPPQASLSITNSRSLLKLMFTTLVMPSNHLILYRIIFLKWKKKTKQNKTSIGRWIKWKFFQNGFWIFDKLTGYDLSSLISLSSHIL